MKSSIKKLLLAALVVIALLVVYTIIKPGWFMDVGMALTGGMKHRNAATEKPAYTINAQTLTDEFKKDTTALTKYIDKAILIKGKITAIEGTHVSMDNVLCNIDSLELPRLAKLTVGQTASFQGRLTTYNDLMGEIDLDQCVIK
jgi:hypothetical protein